MSLSGVLKQELPLRNKLAQNHLVKKEVKHSGKEMNAIQHSFAKNPEGRTAPPSSAKLFDDW